VVEVVIEVVVEVVVEVEVFPNITGQLPSSEVVLAPL
jgi:hypothetical protein